MMEGEQSNVHDQNQSRRLSRAVRSLRIAGSTNTTHVMTTNNTLELDDYYEQRFVTDLMVSPDGSRVAFLMTEFDGEEDDRCQSLFVAPSDGSAFPHRLTRVSDAQQPKWGPNGDQLAFIATREDKTLRLGRPNPENGTRPLLTRSRQTSPRRHQTMQTPNPNPKYGSSTCSVAVMLDR